MTSVTTHSHSSLQPVIVMATTPAPSRKTNGSSGNVTLSSFRGQARQSKHPTTSTTSSFQQLQFSLTNTQISSQFWQEWEGIVHFLHPTLTFLPALHVWGGSGFPSHDCLEGTGEFYLCDRCIEGTSSVTDTTPCKDQTGEGSTFPVSQQEVARTFP